MSFQLFGDGVHDDTDAIQQRIWDARGELTLPMPQTCYLISRPLELPSCFRLALPRYAHIRLANDSNCLMLKNAQEPQASQNIEVCGGIWDLNNLGQRKNPFNFPDPQLPDYNGFGMFFSRVRGLRLADLTLKDPVTFAATLDTVSYFTVENITFDFNYGNPTAVNMDGIHLNGNCHFGTLRNLKGSCYDDLVALNADEGSDGPITNIDIDGIYAQDCHSAVRLLTVKNAVENIHIHNVFGTYYQYCVGVTKFYKGDTTGYYDAVMLDHIFAAKAVRHSIYQKDGSYVYPLIWVEGDTKVKSLHIAQVQRKEYHTPVETLHIGRGALVDQLIVQEVSVENHTGTPMPVVVNHGTVGRAVFHELDGRGDAILENDGQMN